ncbi:MAG: cupin domain-containing protein [Peptococcaceae bacterium]|jgi:quercetin dioxygenase-like cupin family protein|nr:cupin domain-containing protein [Peptococcaceae bacterium]MDH7525974.1 cupin domain-containing protein [Peptococcaceae bacterium]
MVKPILFDYHEAEPDTSRPGGRTYVFQGSEHVTIQYSEIFSDPENFTHTHDYEQVIIILGGKANFWCDGVAYGMSEGCYMVVPPNVAHGIEKRIGDEELRVLEVFYPKRTADRIQSRRVTRLGHQNWD